MDSFSFGLSRLSFLFFLFLVSMKSFASSEESEPPPPKPPVKLFSVSMGPERTQLMSIVDRMKAGDPKKEVLIFTWEKGMYIYVYDPKDPYFEGKDLGEVWVLMNKLFQKSILIEKQKRLRKAEKLKQEEEARKAREEEEVREAQEKEERELIAHCTGESDAKPRFPERRPNTFSDQALEEKFSPRSRRHHSSRSSLGNSSHHHHPHGGFSHRHNLDGYSSRYHHHHHHHHHHHPHYNPRSLGGTRHHHSGPHQSHAHAPKVRKKKVKEATLSQRIKELLKLAVEEKEKLKDPNYIGAFMRAHAASIVEDLDHLVWGKALYKKQLMKVLNETLAELLPKEAGPSNKEFLEASRTFIENVFKIRGTDISNARDPYLASPLPSHHGEAGFGSFRTAFIQFVTLIHMRY